MAIDREVLNVQIENPTKITTGVYLSHNRQTAVCVKTGKDGHVHYLSFATGTLRLERVPLFQFVRDWPIHLPNYPARRALRGYARCGLAIEATAAAVLRAALA